MKIQLRGWEPEKIKNWLKERNESGFRGDQIFSWTQKGVRHFDEMTNLPKLLRAVLSENFILDNVRIAKALLSKDGTKKFLLVLRDGEMVEAVLMKYKHGYTLCVSTQVGCQMGCTFCASTLGGRVRQLETAEMVGQILEIQREEKVRIGHVVLMGSGEPLDNYEAVLSFLRLLNNEKGLHISMRNITVSTCGLVPEILALSKENIPITLAVSLHAIEDEDRNVLMPVNRRYGISELLFACEKYTNSTGRRITFEYALISGKNDSRLQARALAKKLKGFLCHVNLIPINPVKERDYTASSQKRILEFQKELKNAGIQTTVRRELGSDINAACGQLRNSQKDIVGKIENFFFK